MAHEVRGGMDGESGDIVEVMRQQWASMVSMGGMFVGTILLGLSIQPIYDVPEARAFGEEGAYPVSASFYTNSFLHPQGGLFDLTKLATLFDADGGGHANACGCRIKPIRGHRSGEEGVSVEDIELNVAAWLELWAGR